MLQNMAALDVPSFVLEYYKQQEDATIWELYVHKYNGQQSYVEFKSDIMASRGSGLTAEEKVEQDKEAKDFASQFIKFAD